MLLNDGDNKSVGLIGKKKKHFARAAVIVVT